MKTFLECSIFLFILNGVFGQANSCGAVHNTQNGAIYHKPTGPILDNERCAWVIGVKGAVGYTIEIQYLGNPTNQPGGNQELALTGFRHGTPILSTYVPTSTGIFTVTDVNLVVVSFHSLTLGDVSNTGFVMRYESIQFGNITKTSNQSEHHFLNSPTFPFYYPPRPNRYASLELAAFLGQPTRKCSSRKSSHILLQEISLYGAFGRDFIIVYRFNVDLPADTAKWEEVGRIDAPVVPQLFSSEDMLLLIFISDNDSNVGNGFKLSFVGC